jgi:hypothetical protein
LILGVIEMSQEFSSKNTSVNTITKVYKRFKFKANSLILDYGGGKYDTNKAYLESLGHSCYVYDPYNRSKEENELALSSVLSRGGADVVVCANVLNVIKEDSIIQEILQDILNYVHLGSKVYIQIYEGNKSGVGLPTSRGYQRNEVTSQYLDMIKKVYAPNKIFKHGNIYEIFIGE